MVFYDAGLTTPVGYGYIYDTCTYCDRSYWVAETDKSWWILQVLLQRQVNITVMTQLPTPTFTAQPACFNTAAIIRIEGAGNYQIATDPLFVDIIGTAPAGTYQLDVITQLKTFYVKSYRSRWLYRNSSTSLRAHENGTRT
ncbi:MAG: hypothetical protein U0T69_06410 [Chitinophagales bacterium]